MQKVGKIMVASKRYYLKTGGIIFGLAIGTAIVALSVWKLWNHESKPVSHIPVNGSESASESAMANREERAEVNALSSPPSLEPASAGQSTMGGCTENPPGNRQAGTLDYSTLNATHSDDYNRFAALQRLDDDSLRQAAGRGDADAALALAMRLFKSSQPEVYPDLPTGTAEQVPAESKINPLLREARNLAYQAALNGSAYAVGLLARSHQASVMAAIEKGVVQDAVPVDSFEAALAEAGLEDPELADWYRELSAYKGMRELHLRLMESRGLEETVEQDPLEQMVPLATDTEETLARFRSDRADLGLPPLLSGPGEGGCVTGHPSQG